VAVSGFAAGAVLKSVYPAASADAAADASGLASIGLAAQSVRVFGVQ
jgi:hypothetical protein